MVEGPRKLVGKNYDSEISLYGTKSSAGKEGLWWPDVHVDEWMRIPASHWYYKPQPAEFLLSRRLLQYPDLFDRPDNYGPATMLRVVEAFGLDLPANMPAHRRIDNLDNPMHADDDELGARMARGMRMEGFAPVATGEGLKHVPKEVEVQTSYIKYENIAPGFNTNGPTIIPRFADFSTDIIYKDPIFIGIEDRGYIVFTEVTMNTYYLNREGERQRQAWYVVVLPATGGAVVTPLTSNAVNEKYRVYA